MRYLNISGYKFAKVANAEQLKNKWRLLADELNIKGTILLAEEGLNVALAAEEEALRKFLNVIRETACFSDLEVKDSWSSSIPFRRIRIRVKAEIIMMRVPGVDPLNGTGKYLPAKQLKQWYDEGKDFVIVDTRNDYEFKVGTFKNAVDLNIANFSDFPEAIKKLAKEHKQKPIVTFCTGGVRCEKATVIMQGSGFDNVYQLEGGIIRYLEETNGDYWDGECFVFDDRIAVKKDLSPTDKKYCLSCLAEVTQDEMAGEQFAYNKYCPHCFETDVEPSEKSLLA